MIHQGCVFWSRRLCHANMCEMPYRFIEYHALLISQRYAMRGRVGASKHDALAQCWADVGPSSTTLAQHQPSIGTTPRVCWVV